MTTKLKQTIKSKAITEIQKSIIMLDKAQDVLMAVRDEGKFEPLPTKIEIQQAINDMENIRLALYHAQTRAEKGS